MQSEVGHAFPSASPIAMIKLSPPRLVGAEAASSSKAASSRTASPLKTMRALTTHSAGDFSYPLMLTITYYNHSSTNMNFLTFRSCFCQDLCFGTDLWFIPCPSGKKSLLLRVGGVQNLRSILPLTSIQESMDISRRDNFLATYWHCYVKGNWRIPRNKLLPVRLLTPRNTWHWTHMLVGDMRKSRLSMVEP